MKQLAAREASAPPAWSRLPANFRFVHLTLMAREWTTGAPKWFAVMVLAAASFGALAWSLLDREQGVIVERQALQAETLPRRPMLASHEPARPLVDGVTTETVSEAHGDQSAAGDKVSALFPDLPPPSRMSKPALTRTINLNTATAADLQLLPGIGPAMSARILEHRSKIGRFTSIEQLDDVRGIGPKTLEKLRPLVRVD
jgi:comEA protein